MRRSSGAFRLSLCAILAAGSVVTLYLSALSPIARWGLVAVAGLFPVAAVIDQGWKGGLCVWAVAGILGLVLIPSRENALLYASFFGLYPVVKSLLEQRLGRWLCLLGKLCFFNAVAAVLYLLFAALFLPALPWGIAERPYLIFLWGSAVFIAYDYGLSRLIALYLLRVDKAVRR